MKIFRKEGEAILHALHVEIEIARIATPGVTLAGSHLSVESHPNENVSEIEIFNPTRMIVDGLRVVPDIVETLKK